MPDRHEPHIQGCFHRGNHQLSAGSAAGRPRQRKPVWPVPLLRMRGAPQASRSEAGWRVLTTEAGSGCAPRDTCRDPQGSQGVPRGTLRRPKHKVRSPKPSGAGLVWWIGEDVPLALGEFEGHGKWPLDAGRRRCRRSTRAHRQEWKNRRSVPTTKGRRDEKPVGRVPAGQPGVTGKSGRRGDGPDRKGTKR